MKGIKYFSPLSEYIKLTFNPSEMSNYFKMACIFPKNNDISSLKAYRDRQYNTD